MEGSSPCKLSKNLKINNFEIETKAFKLGKETGGKGKITAIRKRNC